MVRSVYYQSSGNCHVWILFRNGENCLFAGSLFQVLKYRNLKLNFGDQPNLLELKLSTDSELIIYGLSLETPTGIQVDNIALRGKSLPEFYKVRFKQVYRNGQSC